MPEQTMRVTKTLVIGLGSTGTLICDEVAKRIDWELGDLEKAPWVRFLCLETDLTQTSRFQGSPDFLPLEISDWDYQAILDDPRPYDEKIRLTQWADMETLRRLPGRRVDAGAGNIRMVGRLAFLHESNYNRVKVALTQRLSRLRELSEARATEERGSLSDGSNPPVQFSSPDTLRVLVTGTLCGGTCSGLAADFGFFLRTLCSPEDRIVAAFTLPRADLAPALMSGAEKYKKNAYFSLLELNHYCVTGRPKEAGIRYPDGVIPDTRKFPYDITFLALPRVPGPDGLDSLSRAVADRLFLNVFVPQTDPLAEAVDAPTPYDRDDRAHVFCSFGLSTVEFPAYQVIEACAKRLVARALGEWENRSLPEAERERRLDEIGLTWQGLRNLLLRSAQGDLQQQVGQKVAELVRMARAGANLAESTLNEMRAELMLSVRSAIPQNQRRAAEAVVEALRTQLRVRLLDYHDGPAPALEVIRAARQRLLELKGASPPEPGSSIEQTNKELEVVRAYDSSLLLRLFMLRGRAVASVLPRLRACAEREIGARINAEVSRALRAERVRPTDEPPVIERTDRLFDPVQRRLENLRTRLVRLRGALTEAANRLARTMPPVNGVCIFDPETPGEGTVPKEYMRCLTEAAHDPAITWEAMQVREAAEVVRAWDTLPEAVIPARSAEEDWLLKPMNAKAGLNAIPRQDLARLEERARMPFLSLTSEDVLRRWQAIQDAPLQARDAAAKAVPFLRVDKARAEAGGRSPIAMRRTVLVPQDSTYQDQFVRYISGVWPDCAHEASPHPFRAVLLEEWYKFPLTGASEVLGPSGIHAARCDDFPTFHSRKDVPWRGISDSDVEARRRAEELLAVGLLSGVLEPRGGNIVVTNWPAGPFTAGGERYLPLDLAAAVHCLAREDRDTADQPLRSARQHIKHLVDDSWRSKAGPDITARAQEFIRALEDKLRSGTGSEIPGWSRELAARYLARYCAQDRDLAAAVRTVFRPSEATIRALAKSAGDALASGKTAEKDGLYCTLCGGAVGTDEEDAARNGWMCYVNPEHYFGISLA